MKRVGIILALVLIAALVLPAASYAAGPAQVKIPAGVEIMKKGTVIGNNLPWFYDVTSTRRPVQGPKAIAAKGILGAPVAGQRYAIVIGVTDYPGQDMDLKYAANDAYDVYGVLSLYGFQDSNITLLTNSDASRDNVLGAIAGLQQAVTADDEVVFFYSGHGAKSYPGMGVISEGMVLWGAETPEPAIELVWDKELKAAFSLFATNRIVFAFDSCWSGGFNDLAGPGRIVLSATDRNGLAAEVGADEGFPEVNNGLFTYFTFELGLGYGLADIYDNDGNPATPDVTIEEAYDFARYNLTGLSLAYQSAGLWEIPNIYDQFKGDLLF